MSDLAGKMERLARAQGGMARVLEAKLAREERRVAELSEKKTELYALSSSTAPSKIAFLPQALRLIAETESELRRTVAAADIIRQELIAAKSRQKMMTKRGRRLGEAAERKAGEESALDAALAMAAKASGKQGVVS